LAAAVIDGRLYAIGGRIDGNYSRNLSTNESYDPATDRWEQRAPMPTARSGIAAAVLHGRIFVFGGEATRAPSARWKRMIPETIPGAVICVCRRHDTASAPRPSQAGFT
jgi:Kelch motif